MTRLRQMLARNRRRLPVVGLGIVLVFAAAPWGWATLPNPVILSQYDVTIRSGAFTKTLQDLTVGQVHHLDVDGDGGTIAGGCGGYFEIGEVGGRCESNPDVTLKTTIETSFASLLTIPTAAPVVRINRAPSAVIEGRPAPPLEIVVEFTVRDTHDVEPDTRVRFGYATPAGGTIPSRLTGVVGGLTPPTLPPPPGWQPFNPVEILLDSGQFTTLSGAAGVPPTYSGPLTILGGVSRDATADSQPVTADVELAYKPLPERVRVNWTRVDAEHRNIFTYEHDAPGLWQHHDDPTDCPPLGGPAGCPRDVDVRAEVTTIIGDAAQPDAPGNEVLRVTAGVDRLPATPLLPNNPDGTAPPRVTADITALTEDARRTQGSADLLIPVTALTPSGRLPDATVQVVSRKPPAVPGGDPQVQVVNADVEQIPNSMHAEWYLPVKPTPTEPGCTAIPAESLPGFVDDRCLAEALFRVNPVPGASAPHVGGVQLSVANYEGDPAAFTPHVPGREQYVNLQSGPTEPGSEDLQQLLSARVERIRSLSFTEQADGFAAHARVGDGGAPLELHVGTDERTLLVDPGEEGPADDEFGELRDLTALLSPLPDDVTVDVQLPSTDEGAERPLQVAWDATAGAATSVDLDADVQIRGRDAAEGAACGEPFTTCATAAVDHIPTAGTVTFDRTDDRLLLKVDTTPEAGAEAPDVVADFKLRPSAAEAPLVGHVDIRRLPRHATVRALTPLLPAAEGEEPERGLTRLQLHPCDYDFAARACVEGSAGKFGALTFNVRSFLQRPELPLSADPADRVPLHPPIATTPTYLSAALRDGATSVDTSPVPDSLLFEVEGHFTEVDELQYLNPGGVIGGRIRAGDGAQPFTAAVDVGAVELSDGDNPTDLRANAVLHTLPTQVDLCFRSAADEAPGGDPFDPEITAVCESALPFGEQLPLDDTPMSLALAANDEFVLDVDFTKVDRGADDASATDDATVVTRLHVDEVPRTLAVHVQTPPDEGDGPLRAVFDTADHSEAVTVEFAAEVRDGDLFCSDARIPIEVAPDDDGSRQFQDVLCVEGRIDNLPTHAFLAYDPTAKADNFHFDHNGGTDVDLQELLLTRVGGDLDDRNVPETPDDESDDTVVADVLVAEGFLEGLPPVVEGDLVLPGTVELRSVAETGSETAGDPVERVNVTVRNFIAPDPMPRTIPSQREVNGSALPEPNQKLVVFQRDDLFKATVDVSTLVKAGFATSRDVDGNLLDTNVVTVDFGRPDDVIRAYADLQLFTADDDPSTTDVDEEQESLSAVIGDVTLQDKPAGVVVCFRGADPLPAPPVEPTFCDTEPAHDEGAFQVLGRPFEAAPDDQLDVDAFLRYGRAGGTDVLAAAAHIDNVPLVVQGTYGGNGRVDVGGFGLNADGTGAGAVDGIDGIGFELANFDLKPAGHGYDEDPPPWGNSVPGFTEDYSRERLGDHFVRVKVRDELFFVQGNVGVPDSATDSELQRVFLSGEPCAFDDPADAPADYPHFPDDVSSDYTCVRGEFEQVGGGTDGALFTEITVDKGNEHLSLNGVRPDGSLARAGLTSVPDTFQATLAETPKQQADGALRPPCGPATAHQPTDVGCMPPLLRLDLEAAEDPAFFGVLETGALRDVERLREIAPMASIAGADGAETIAGEGLHAAPGRDGFGNWSDGHGARVRIGKLPPEEGAPAADGTTVIAGVHLPVTASLTVDQLQTWDCEDGTGGCPDVTDPFDDAEDEAKAKDIRIHYVARDDDGAIVPTIGQLALMVLDEGGGQILLADPDDADNAGITLPGELGLSLYQRDGWDPAADDKQRSRKFLQIDGRISSPTEIGARIFGDEVDVVHAKLKGLPTVPEGDVDPLSPSFRLRLNSDDLKDANDGPDGILETIADFLAFDFDLGDAKGSCEYGILKCTLTSVRINQINAEIDFAGAKRVDAYVTLDKPQNGIELRGYDELHGTAVAAPVTTRASVDIDPLVVFIHLGVPVIAGADVVLAAEVDAKLNFDEADEARWRNDTTRIKMEHEGDSGGADVDLGITPVVAGGLASVVIPVFVPIYLVWGFTYAWIPTVGPPVDVTYIGCGLDEFDYSLTSNVHRIGAGGDTDVYADISFDPRMIQYGSFDLTSLVSKWFPGSAVANTIYSGVGATGAPLMTIFSYIAGCGVANADLGLIDASPIGPPFTVATHPVPDFDAPVAPLPQPPPPPEPPPAITISDAQTVCGRIEASTFTVAGGGSATVGSAPGPYCTGAAADVGHLELVAETVTVRSGGLLDARGATGLVELFAEAVTVQAPSGATGAGRILAGTQPLHLRGLRRVQIDGTVSGDGVSTSTSVGGSAAASGNSGAGHGAAGGDGSTGTGGAAFGDPSLEADTDTGLLPSERGTRGAGPGTPGRGGGRIHLSGNVVRISGTVTARGISGSASTSGACAVADNPDTTEVNEATPNTGGRGSGGGSGGTLAISAQRVDTTGGVVSVRGGNGGSGKAGGGGGGAAGVAKVVAPVLQGPAINTDGGTGGGNGGCGESARGDDGGDSTLLVNNDPSSWAALPNGDLFVSGDGLEVPFTGAANEVGDSDDFQVVLCGLHRPPEAAEHTDPEDAESKYGIDVPASSTRSVRNPCGTDTGDTTTHVLGTAEFTDAVEVPADSTMTATPEPGDSVQFDEPSGNGWWGIYTVIFKPSTDGNNCMEHTGPFALAFDEADCDVIEALPAEPDVVVGVDNTPPEIASFSAPEAPTTESIQLAISGVTDRMPRQSESGEIDNSSGVARVECSNDQVTWTRCGVGIVDWELPPGSGPKTVSVRATDLAGNERVVDFDLTLDVTPPESQATPTPAAPDGSNGWYRSSPTFAIHSFSDADSGPGVPAPYSYWFNGGTHRTCGPDEIADADNPECAVTAGLPGIGTHRFNWQAVDLAGHHEPVQSLPFKVDGKAPDVELLTAPFSPDAANGWFGLRPFAVVSAFDQPGGSGLEPLGSGDPDTGVFLGIDGATPTRQTRPTRLEPGPHELCFFARDVAGNTSATTCRDVLVDDEQPTVAISTAPAAPNGGDGWFVTTPSVTVTGADASSTVDDTFDATADLCGPLPVDPDDPPTPSGVCVSYDGAPYEPFTAAHVFTDDGTHTVRAFSVDVAGKRSALRTAVVRFDPAAPATLLRTEPPAPALNDRFRRTPTVALAAAEPQADNAGIDVIRYRIDAGAWATYTQPFPVPEGDHTISYQAFDRAGNAEPVQTRRIVVDTTPPTADAVAGFPNPWNRPAPSTAALSWSAFDALSDSAHTSVVVFGAELVSQSVVGLRRIEHGPDFDPSPAFGGATAWDGDREVQTVGGVTLVPVSPRPGCTAVGCVPGGLPLPGRYWFQVVVTDEAGNVAQTDESAYLQVNT